MIHSLYKLSGSIAFERWALEQGQPLEEQRVIRSIELWPNGITTTFAEFIDPGRGEAYEELRSIMRLLLVGCAWKILDLVYEFALFSAGILPSRSARYTIEEKVRLAREGRGTCGTLSSDCSLWRGILCTYAAFEDLRHSLVHRKVRFNTATKALEGETKSGNPVKPITATEVDALCALSQLVAQAVICDNEMPCLRRRLLISNQLNKLRNHHGQPLLEAAELGIIELRVLPELLDGAQTVDLSRIQQTVEIRGMPFVGRLFNVIIVDPVDRRPRLTGHLEDVLKYGPIFVVDFANPPKFVTTVTDRQTRQID